MATARDELGPRAERGFWSRVTNRDSADGCWLWVGAFSDGGYGRYTYQRADGRALAARAHRITYELLVGPVPDGLQLDHLCRNRACVNPAHLEPVTARVNMLRSSRFIGGHIERREHDWRVVWREDGRKRQRVFASEAEAQAFIDLRKIEQAA